MKQQQEAEQELAPTYLGELAQQWLNLQSLGIPPAEIKQRIQQEMVGRLQGRERVQQAVPGLDLTSIPQSLSPMS